MNTTSRRVMGVLMSLPLLASCGNKGELTLEPQIINPEDLDIVSESVLDPAEDDDEKKPPKRPQQPDN